MEKDPSIPEKLPEEIQNTKLKIHMHPYILCSIIYNSQVMHATQYPSSDEWIKKNWYIYITEYNSPIAENEILPLAIILLDLLYETNRKKQMSYDCTYIQKLKNKIVKVAEQNQTNRYREHIDGC